MNKKTIKLTAKMVNDKFRVKIFDESFDGFKLIKYTEKEINEMQIDDLIQNGKWTNRLITFVHEMQMELIK